MKKFLLIGLLGTVLIGMSGCTEIQKDSKNNTENIKTSVTVSLYSNNGEIFKKYADKNMKVNHSDSGTVILYFSDKKVTTCNVPVVIEEN
ncbi:DUF5052 domain-containing protein [Clostridioides difficile]|uniref:hypothetical protein n=1 Tax=Clostridioides difficile TaxID=1496 RepID=UPI00038CA502|nr:hypothetical protein [Clostridioides difficile]EQJ88727.1 putative lipoprotein [Clostridioides difficile P50]MCE4883903.1 DUF5052 domain-containing protein [Clostridioides difficile]MCO8835419.1 DUF5052 domain-containing protein [Clostridioides difficile]MCP3278075.1 DUF5052 domain-containing protein [Clostridioides difficile]MCR1410091.1 DUF5052 domain-containing protein [Clostridioides difficile]